MKITKSQLRQLVMEELSEQMPETAEGDGFGETLPAAMYVSSAGNEVTFTVKVSKVDERTVDIDGLDMAIQRAYEQGSHESGPDTPDDLAGMEEAKSWKAQRRAAFHAANDEYLKTHDKEWWDAHEKRAKEDEYKPDPHGKYAREKASDDMAKGGVKEGRISKSALNAIIAEEYERLVNENDGGHRIDGAELTKYFTFDGKYASPKGVEGGLPRELSGNFYVIVNGQKSKYAFPAHQAAEMIFKNPGAELEKELAVGKPHRATDWAMRSGNNR